MDTIPAELLNTPLEKIQLNLLTLSWAWYLLRRGYANLRAGGGLYGLWIGLIHGDKTPEAKARDDAKVSAKLTKPSAEVPAE